MTKEYLHELVQMEGALRFFNENYPVNEGDIKTVIEEAKRHETIHLKPSSHLIFNIAGVAERIGIVHDRGFPLNHLPTMLAAVKELEMTVPSDEKLLTHNRILELLATAELTTAHARANRLFSYEGVAEHARRAIKLLEFRDKI